MPYKPQQPSLYADRPSFVAWYRRPGEKWRAVAQADSDAEAFQLLLQYSARMKARASDLIVLPEGKNP